MNRLFSLGAVLLALSGCSSVIEGTHQEILVNTNPPGASCDLSRDGAMIGRITSTPAVVTVSKTKDDIAVVCRKAGYRDVSLIDRSGVSGAVAANALNGAIGWGVDSITGADNKYDRTVNLALTPISVVEVSAASLPGAKLGDLANSEDGNIILRFQALRRLYDEGLITRDEYDRRRGVNLGALLRYSAPAPASDLGRPAPDPEQVVQRLRYLAAAFEEKSITAREQTAERTAILNALLPAAPVAKADPPRALKDQLQAAAEVGRLERLNLAKVITSDEQTREKNAVYQNLQTNIVSAETATRVAAGMAPPPAPATGPGVWLGSYRSENQAKLAWASLQLTHASELGSLQPEVRKVTQRRWGVSYQLKAGPVADKKAAANLCKSLKARRQFCRPAVLGK